LNTFSSFLASGTCVVIEPALTLAWIESSISHGLDGITTLFLSVLAYWSLFAASGSFSESLLIASSSGSFLSAS